MEIPAPDASPATIAAHPIDTLRAASAVPEALAQRVAAEHYGLIATVHRLDSERDQNFRLRSLSGREYVLKIANPAEDRAVTNLQTEALLHLAAADPGLPVPRLGAAFARWVACCPWVTSQSTLAARKPIDAFPISPWISP